jgi:hypothetical protein
MFLISNMNFCGGLDEGSKKHPLYLNTVGDTHPLEREKR